MEKLSPEKMEQINELKRVWIERQTKQFSLEEITQVVNEMWEYQNLPHPEVIVEASPKACIERLVIYKNNHKDPQYHGATFDSEKSYFYNGIWWRCWSAWYQAAKLLGVDFDEKKLDLFTRWTDMANCCITYNEVCFVSMNPVQICWVDEQPHNDSGPAVMWPDGYSLYALTGISVNEQIVMRPETQSLEEINSEPNIEVKRIRIERYGWPRYLTEMKAEVLDKHFNEIEGCHEGLMSVKAGAEDMRILVGRCRSTGRVYSMETPLTINTCAEAQIHLRGGFKGNCIGAS